MQSSLLFMKTRRAVPRQQTGRICSDRMVIAAGMTAAIVDETFGGLLLALRQAGALPFWGPAFTASLEVAYKAVRFCLSSPRR